MGVDIGLHRRTEAEPAGQHQPALRPREHPGNRAQILDRLRFLARGGARADVEARDLGDDGRGPEIAHEAIGFVDKAAIGLVGGKRQFLHGLQKSWVGRGALVLQQRGFERRRGERLQIASPDLGVRVFARYDLTLFGDADLPLHRAARLRQDRVVAWTAAAPDRAAAPMEEADAHAMLAEDFDQADLRLVKLPARGDEAAVLVRIGIAEHHLLLAALRIDQLAVLGEGKELIHHADAVAQVLDRLEQRHERQRRRPFRGDRVPLPSGSAPAPACRRRCPSWR